MYFGSDLNVLLLNRWIESVIKEELPSVLDLEDALQNGVYLCKLGMILLPGDDLWKKVYDPDQSKYKVRKYGK